jgi:hypothetical protein
LRTSLRGRRELSSKYSEANRKSGDSFDPDLDILEAAFVTQNPLLVLVGSR